MQDLKGKVAVITGGATGIGFAIAKALGAEGARIVIGEPRENRLQEAVAALAELGVEATYLVCDVTEFEQVEALADAAWQAFGQVDLVFNNAGISQGVMSVVDTPLDHMHRVFDVNFFGVWHGCKVFGQRLIEQGTPAAIYNTGSENSFFVAVPRTAAYVASKQAVYGFTDALREEMPDYIRVGMIAPGFVGSELIPDGMREMGMPPDEFAQIVLKQIRAGETWIVSHGYNQVRIDERNEAINNAYSTYAPREEGDEKYDVRTLLANFSR